MLSNVGETKKVLNKLPPDVKASVIELDNQVINKIKDETTTPKSNLQIRNVSESLIEFIKDEEGSARKKGEPVLTAYDIGDGRITIGWGHSERKSKTKMVSGETKINDKQAETLLAKDIKVASDALNRILHKWDTKKLDVKITQGMYDAMVSMIYNMGIGNFRKSKFIQLVKNNELTKAKEKIKTTAVSYSGHASRREKESNMFSFN